MMVTALVALLVIALTLAVAAVCASEAERERGRRYARGILAERDAARHEANEYRADAADQLKVANKERDLRKAAEARASEMAKTLDILLSENTRMRTDMHVLSQKWK